MATTTASQGAWKTGSSGFALDGTEAVHAAEIVNTVHVTPPPDGVYPGAVRRTQDLARGSGGVSWP